MMVLCQKVVSYSQEVQALQSSELNIGGGELISSSSDRLIFTEIHQISNI